MEVRNINNYRQFIVSHYDKIIIVTSNYTLAKIILDDLKENNLPENFTLQA